MFIFSVSTRQKPVGPHRIAFDPVLNSRRKKRNDRKKSLFIKAHELAVITGGSILVHYYDRLNNRVWAYASDDQLWQKYVSVGVRYHAGTTRCNSNGVTDQDPSSSSSSHLTPTASVADVSHPPTPSTPVPASSSAITEQMPSTPSSAPARVLASAKLLPTDSDLCSSRIRRTVPNRRKKVIMYIIYSVAVNYRYRRYKSI